MHYIYFNMRLISVFVLVFGIHFTYSNALCKTHISNQSPIDSCKKDTLILKNGHGIHYLQLLNKHVKRRVAATLAFPFPFGITGLHRVYLGTSPHVPVVYMATLGGALGILPLIDFCLLMSSPNIDVYCNRNRVFIWQP